MGEPRVPVGAHLCVRPRAAARKPLRRERCRADALLLGVKPAHERDFFATTGTEVITCQLDRVEQRG